MHDSRGLAPGTLFTLAQLDAAGDGIIAEVKSRTKLKKYKDEKLAKAIEDLTIGTLAKLREEVCRIRNQEEKVRMALITKGIQKPKGTGKGSAPVMVPNGVVLYMGTDANGNTVTGAHYIIKGHHYLRNKGVDTEVDEKSVTQIQMGGKNNGRK